ncbi:MAG: Hsp20/alpha crystallin family protein [Chloroflexota bacterium]
MLERWDPTREIRSLQRMVDEFIDEAFRTLAPTYTFRYRVAGPTGEQVMPVNVYHTADEVFCQFIIPAAKPDDIQVDLTGDTLTVRAEIKPVEGDVEWLRREWLPGIYSRTISLPFPVEADKVDARYENGVLTVRLPKVAEVRRRAIKVRAT